MISVAQRNNLIMSIYKHVDIPVIPADDDGDIPARPYMVYSIIRDNGSNGQDILSQRVDEDTEDLFQVYENQKEGTFSFTVHSESRDEAQSICGLLKEYFERIGRVKVAAAGFAVIEVTSTQNRSILFEDHYERRYGFDVRLRYMDRSEYAEESIDELTL